MFVCMLMCAGGYVCAHVLMKGRGSRLGVFFSHSLPLPLSSPITAKKSWGSVSRLPASRFTGRKGEGGRRVMGQKRREGRGKEVGRDICQ